MKDLVVVRLDSARFALAEAKTIHATKKILDVAHAAEIYAKRQGLSEEIIGHAHAIKIEALAKLGGMLKATERNHGAEGIGTSAVPKENCTPTLADLGIDKKISSLAQQIADLPQDKLDAVARRVQTVKAACRAVSRDKKIIKLKAIKPTPVEGVDIRHCSFEELLSEVKPDAVITDPPYSQEFLELYSQLAKACRSVPVVAVMCGQTYLPQVMTDMCQHLEYRWTLAYLTPGGQSPQIWPRKVNTFWKPILLFGKADNWIGDVIRSDVNDNDKRFHGWGQAESGMGRLVEALTESGQTVCDPFLGGATTAVVCMKLGRKFIGCDISKEAVDIARKRVCQK